jgi:AraC-like DNA-binding protein
MGSFNPLAMARLSPAGAMSRRCASPICIVEDEIEWRVRPIGSSGPRVTASRWRSLDQHTRAVSAETPADGHLVAIILRNEDVSSSLAGRTVRDGVVISGTLQVTEPAISARCIFRGPYDVLHLHVPNSLIAEFGRELAGCEMAGLHSEAVLTPDPIAERLARALLVVEEIDGPSGELYADCISTAIVTRLLATTHRERPRATGLARWRLQHVMEYVEAGLAEPMSLADLAAVAGLTRMHFAVQFKAATGLSPHAYLLRRRIERAQEMLAQDHASLALVALSVGFQTQSHFTTVFKRVVGRPPRAWRQLHCVNDPLPLTATEPTESPRLRARVGT